MLYIYSSSLGYILYAFPFIAGHPNAPVWYINRVGSFLVFKKKNPLQTIEPRNKMNTFKDILQKRIKFILIISPLKQLLSLMHMCKQGYLY